MNAGLHRLQGIATQEEDSVSQARGKAIRLENDLTTLGRGRIDDLLVQVNWTGWALQSGVVAMPAGEKGAR
jgi:hypothetical protein